jgi:hypothetical protein
LSVICLWGAAAPAAAPGLLPVERDMVTHRSVHSGLMAPGERRAGPRKGRPRARLTLFARADAPLTADFGQSTSGQGVVSGKRQTWSQHRSTTEIRQTEIQR